MPTLGPKKKTGSLVVFLLGQPADSDGEMRSLLPERVPCEGPPLDRRSQKLSRPCRLGKSTGVYVLYSGTLQDEARYCCSLAVKCEMESPVQSWPASLSMTAIMTLKF